MVKGMCVFSMITPECVCVYNDIGVCIALCEPVHAFVCASYMAWEYLDVGPVYTQCVFMNICE